MKHNTCPRCGLGGDLEGHTCTPSSSFIPKYTEAEIEAAIDRVYIKSSTGNLTARKVLEELRTPKPVFSEGQVAYDEICDEYFKVNADNLLRSANLKKCRKLVQSEVPDWIERKPAMDLRDGAISILLRALSYDDVRRMIKRITKDFDTATGE